MSTSQLEEYSVYASRPSEISVEVEKSDSQSTMDTQSSLASSRSISGTSSTDLMTARSASNDTVISYKIDTDILTAISSSHDLSTAKAMGLFTFVELDSNKEDLPEDDIETAKSVNQVSSFSAYKAKIEPPSAAVTYQDDFSLRTAASAGSVSWYSLPPSETDCQLPNMEDNEGAIRAE